jgi:apolipoprotein N-acyltransferase
MKSLEKTMSRLMMLVMTMFASVYAIAQEEAAKLDVNVTRTETTTWYTNPWVWIVGVAVFILLFAAIVRGGSRTDA